MPRVRFPAGCAPEESVSHTCWKCAAQTRAFPGLFGGENYGKLLIRVGDCPIVGKG